MQRADVWVWRGVSKPLAVLVLVPGYNGNGEGLVRSAEWQEFARKHQLGLAGISFESTMAEITDNRDYSVVTRGSGDLLLGRLREAYGRDLPLLMSGFSRGAFFAARFAEWKPERVLAWSAYSMGDLEEPAASTEAAPPGIVACGELDPWLGSSIVYFKQGRAAGKPWLWISVKETGHAWSASLNAFIREYFEAILLNKGKLDTAKEGVWIDVDREQTVNPASEPASVTGWLPSPRLLDTWRKLHQP